MLDAVLWVVALVPLEKSHNDKLALIPFEQASLRHSLLDKLASGRESSSGGVVGFVFTSPGGVSILRRHVA